MNRQEAQMLWRADRSRHEDNGVYLPLVQSYMPDDFAALAMDAAIPATSTEANSAVPAMLTTFIDPEVLEIRFAPNAATEIIGEKRKGDWTTETAMFPVTESTGEVSSYGDYNENGASGVNINWPNRQSYRFQIIKRFGELEVERGALAKVNIVSEKDKAAALNLNKFSNLTYFYGVQGLQCYGLLNDPNLSASLTPATKAAGGTAWVNGSGVVVATANEIFTDIQSLIYQLVKQSQGIITQDSDMTLAMAPTTGMAMTATNAFNVNVRTLLKDNFPNLKINTRAVQYAALSATNPQGNAAGNLVQLIATSIEGSDSAYCAFTEKMRAHRVIYMKSAWEQKISAGTWGAIVRQPFAIGSMVGV